MDSQHYQEDADGESVSFPVPVRPQRYFSLKWNNFENQLLLSFSDLYMSKEFTDISLICEGKTVRAHKIILSMCSPYFRHILKENPLKHPTVILDGVSYEALSHVLEFIYLGKVVCVSEDQIQNFMETAEFFQLDGMEDQPQKGRQYPQDGHVSPSSFYPPISKPHPSAPLQLSSTLSHQPKLPSVDINYPLSSLSSHHEITHAPPLSAIEALCNLNRTVGLSSPQFSNPPPKNHEVAAYKSIPYQIPSTVENLYQNQSQNQNQNQLSSHHTLDYSIYSTQYNPLHNHQQYNFSPQTKPTKPTKQKGKRPMQSRPLNLAPKRQKSRVRPKKAKKLTAKEKEIMSQYQLESQNSNDNNEAESVHQPSRKSPGETRPNNVKLFTTETGIVVSVLGRSINALVSQQQMEEEESGSPVRNQSSQSTPTSTPIITIGDDDNENENGDQSSPILLSPSPSPAPSSTASLQIALSPSPVHPSELNFPISLSPTSHSSNSTFHCNSTSNRISNYPCLNKDGYYSYDSSSSPNSNNSTTTTSSRSSGVATTKSPYIHYSGAFPPPHSLPHPLPHGLTLTPPQNIRNKSTNGPNGSSGSQPLKYTSAEVRALVDSVANVTGHFVPCKLCEKVVKRERLRSHIYECHLVNGQKINCPYCGVGLKSKGSYRVHVWRHRKGSLKNSGGLNSKKLELKIPK